MILQVQAFYLRAWVILIPKSRKMSFKFQYSMQAIDSINISANISNEKIHKGSALCKRHKKGTRNYFILCMSFECFVDGTWSHQHRQICIYTYIERWCDVYGVQINFMYFSLLVLVVCIGCFCHGSYIDEDGHILLMKNLKFIMKKGIFQWNVDLQTKYMKRKNINETINSSPQNEWNYRLQSAQILIGEFHTHTHSSVWYEFHEPITHVHTHLHRHNRFNSNVLLFSTCFMVIETNRHSYQFEIHFRIRELIFALTLNALSNTNTHTRATNKNGRLQMQCHYH